MGPPSLDIFHYTDFREFLRQRYEADKRLDRGFTQRHNAEKVGASSAGWFSDVVKGRIALTGGFVVKLIKLLSLKPKEGEYFETMVHYAQAGSLEEKSRHMERLLSFKELKVDVLGRDKFEYYSKWYHAAIRELLLFHPFRGDYPELARLLSPAIRPAQARKSIELLLRLELVAIDPNGIHRPTAAIVKKDAAFKSVHLANYLKANIEMGIGALDRYPKEERFPGLSHEPERRKMTRGGEDRGAPGMRWLLMAGLLVCWGCMFQAQDTTVGTEVENEIDMGRILEPGGEPAAGAVVRVIPVAYNPQPPLKKTTLVYKLEADARGRLNLAGIPGGQYNILAAKDGLVAYQDSVIINQGGTLVKADTLGAPGSVAGTVALQPNHNPASALVEVLGTTHFANVDASGRFELHGLAEGNYSVRVSTSLADYASQYTGFTVAAGWRNEIADTLRPVYIGMPVITGLRAHYDTAAGAVTLSWNRARFTNLLGYVVFRDTVLSRTLSVQPINKSRILDSVFTDNLAWRSEPGEPAQHWEYRVAILGSNGKYGEAHEVAGVEAVSPAVLKTFVRLTAENTQRDMVSVGQPFRLVAGFENGRRSNTRIAWRLAGTPQPLRVKSLTTRSGADTLDYLAPSETGLLTFEVTVTDETGVETSASTSLQVVLWKRRSDRPLPAYARAGRFPVDMPIAELGGKLYVFGSRGEEPHTSMTVYDPTAGAWSRVAEAPTLGNPVVVKDRIYLAHDGSLSAYDPASDAWTERAPLLVQREPHTPVPGLEAGGKLVIYDGRIVSKEPGNPQAFLGSAMELYDPDQDSWSRLAAPNTISSAGLFGHQGRIFKTGYRTLSEYDSTRNAWKEISKALPPEELIPMVPFENTLNFLYNKRQVASYLLQQEAVDYRAATPEIPAYTDFSFHVMDGKIYGLFQTGEGLITVAMYRRSENKWSLMPAIATEGNRFVAAVAAGRLFVVSYHDLRSSQRELLPATYEYPPLP